MMEKSVRFKITDYRILEDNLSLAKYASADYDPEFLYVWVRAISAGEYYGSNANADYFPEAQLIDWHSTFLNAKVFKNHENKQVEKAIGEVLEAVWKDKMKYVELLIRIDRKLAPEIVRGFEKGFITDVSMGCRVKYTVCSICGNKAKTRKDFCTHVKNMRNELMPDGKRVFEVNYEPKFHDISVVIRGADRTAKILEIPNVNKSTKTATYGDVVSTGFEKVASLSKEKGEELSNLMKNATIRGKIAEITKVIKDKLYTLAIVKKLNKNLKNVKPKEAEKLIEASEDFISGLLKQGREKVVYPKMLGTKGRLIGAGVIGAASAYEQGKRMRGERTSSFENALADIGGIVALAYLLGAKGAYKSLYKKHQQVKKYFTPGTFDPLSPNASFEDGGFEKFATKLEDFHTIDHFSFEDEGDIFKDSSFYEVALKKFGSDKKLGMIKLAVILFEAGRKNDVDTIKSKYNIIDNDITEYLKLALDAAENDIEKEATFIGSVFRNMIEDNLFTRPGFTAAALPATIIDGILFTKLLGTDKSRADNLKHCGEIKQIVGNLSDTTSDLIGGSKNV